jgi:hypothetical protein
LKISNFSHYKVEDKDIAVILTIHISLISHQDPLALNFLHHPLGKTNKQNTHAKEFLKVMPAILALRRYRQENHEFKTSLDDLVTLRLKKNYETDVSGG